MNSFITSENTQKNVFHSVHFIRNNVMEEMQCQSPWSHLAHYSAQFSTVHSQGPRPTICITPPRSCLNKHDVCLLSRPYYVTQDIFILYTHSHRAEEKRESHYRMFIFPTNKYQIEMSRYMNMVSISFLIFNRHGQDLG